MCKKSNATISELSNAANDGNAHAQLIFGWSYAAKSNENKNYEEAIKWLTRAANSGLQEAQFRLAIVYLMKRNIVGIGILNQLDYNGYSPATYELGNCFYTGLCVDRDELLGVKFWEKSQ